MFWFFEESEGLYKKEFIVVHRFDSGGFVKRHYLVDTAASDYPAVLEVAYDKAVQGCKVFMLPELVENDPLREFLFRGVKEAKCPDLLVDGIYVELKSPLPEFHYNKISNSIKLAANQADHVLIRITDSFNLKELRQIAKGRFKTHKELQVIEFKVQGKYYRYDRKRVLKK